MEESNNSILTVLKEKYLKIHYLLKEASKNDPENEPYKSKYEARDILNEMTDLILEHNQIDEDKHLLDLLAVVYCINSIISYDVEEISKGTELAKKACDIISNPLCPSRILCIMTCYNNLGFWASNREDYNTAQEYLEKSEVFYNRYNIEVKVPAKEFEELFTGEKDPKNEENGYEKCHTQTLFYLAQVYAKNDNPSKAARYCHVTLKRQLEAHEEDAVEWSLNSATLSQFLIEQNAFVAARHHLAASTKVLEKHNQNIDELLSNDPENEELKAKKEKAKHRLADIYRCWAKYSIFLLNGSKDRLVSSEGDKIDPPPQPPEILKGLEFTSLKEETKELEKSVTADFILTYEDAKPLFQKSQEWLNLAKEYYTLEDHASEHAAVAQDSSKLYHLLSFFQSDESIQCKLHKRRIDILSSVVNSLNPTYYLKVCREIWFEIGETCMTMADIKASQARETNDGKSVQHCASKIQQLTSQGIKYLEDFMKSFKLKNKEEKYPEEFEKNIILGYMYLGHLYIRLIDPDKQTMIKYQEESLQCYAAIINYCNEHPDVKKTYPQEYSICMEMVSLIPLKISRMKVALNKSLQA